MHQEANNNINSTINQIFIPDKETAQEIATLLRQNINNNVQIVCNIQNKDKLNKLYQEFGEIVNDFDSICYLSKKQLDKLKSYIIKMEVFEEDFQDESEDGKIFYNNFFALLLHIDIKLFVEKYEKSPRYIRNVLNNKYLYACAIFEIDRKDEAFKLLDEIITFSDEEKYFIQKCCFLIREKKVSDLKQTLNKKSKKEDKYGYYGMFELEILFAKEKSIKKLKKLNKKYNNKPLYHLRMSEIIYDINKKNVKEIKENIRKAFFNIEDNELISILKLLDTAKYVKQDRYLLDLIINKDYKSKYIKCQILNMLINKSEKNKNEINKINDLVKELDSYELVDFDNVNAVLSLENHKELEAIDFFKKSYKKNKSIITASNLLSLILKNNDSRNFNNIPEYINILEKSIKYSDYLLISSAYFILGDYDRALENAYISSVISQENSNCFMRFWSIHTLCKKEKVEIKNVSDGCVIELTDLKQNKKIRLVLDKNISNRFDIYSFQNVKFVNDRSLELSIIGKSIDDVVWLNGNSYKINNIVEKYDYFLSLIFPKINSGKYFKAIVTDDNDDPLKKLKEFLIKAKESDDRHFDMYDLEKTPGYGLPLSSFVNDEDKTYREIILHIIYGRKNSKLYAGEINLIDENDDFVIDITTLVMLKHFNLLERIKNLKNSIYITQSTINNINKIFNYYLNNKKETLSVVLDEDEELRKQEITEDYYKELQEFWRSILEIASQFIIVNHEACIDKRNLESCQIDSIDYSVKTKCILVSEDLLLKKFAYILNDRIVNSTNFLSLAWVLCGDLCEYINLVKELSNGKYIYCISQNTFCDMILFSFTNKEAQKYILEIVDNVFSTNYLYYNYLEIVVKSILNIFYYEDITDKKFYSDLVIKIKSYCEKYNNKSCYDLLEIINKKINNDNVTES